MHKMSMGRVDCKISYIGQRTETLKWANGNSYALVQPDEHSRKHEIFEHPNFGPCLVISINGIGEIRWLVTDYRSPGGDQEVLFLFGILKDPCKTCGGRGQTATGVNPWDHETCKSCKGKGGAK